VPCDGVAVATGAVPLDLARDLAPETVRPALVAFLAREFAGLGAPRAIPSAEGSLVVLLGAYTVTLRAGRIEVGGPAGPMLEQLRSRITALLTGLAGLSLQRELASRIRRAGARVTGQSRAGNGVLVLNVIL